MRQRFKVTSAVSPPTSHIPFSVDMGFVCLCSDADTDHPTLLKALSQ